MIRRIVSLVICVMTMFATVNNVFAEEYANNQIASEFKTESNGVSVYTLSVENAIKMAYESDPQYINLDIKIKDAEKQLESAKRAKKELEGAAIYVGQGIASFAVQKGYYVKQAEIALESAKFEKEQTLAKSAYDITQKYYNVKLAESLVGTAENTYNLAYNNYENVKEQFSLGLVAQIDVNSAKYSVNQAKAMIDKYKRNLTLAQSQLAIALYIEDEKFSFVLTDNLEYEKFTADVSKDKENAMKTRYDVYLLDSSISQAESMLQISRVFGVDSAEYSSSNLAFHQCKTTNLNTKKSIALLIDSAYFSILDKEDEFLLAKENVSLCEQSYDIALAQYDLGIITNSQLTAAMNNTIDSRVALENAKLSHKLAVKKYKYEITIGL